MHVSNQLQAAAVLLCSSYRTGWKVRQLDWSWGQREENHIFIGNRTSVLQSRGKPVYGVNYPSLWDGHVALVKSI